MMYQTKAELEALIKERTAELLNHAGGYTHLARMLVVSSSTTQGWWQRGRVSKEGAKQVEDHPTLGKTFTAEYLRPDLNY